MPKYENKNNNNNSNFEGYNLALEDMSLEC